MALQVESDSFEHGDRVPHEHGFGVPNGQGKAEAGGGNRSPHLRWSGAPEGTQSFAVSCVDPDVPADFTDANQEGKTLPEDMPRQDFTHWLLVDISPEVAELPEGAGGEGIVAGGKPHGETDHGVTGSNSYAEAQGDGTYGGYDGPFPPWNDDRLHHYHFTVYALDVPSLGLSGDFKLDDFRSAIEGHVLDQGEMVGVYTLNADKL
jgi:Raf kinase inhibitor-like YbhB/YbcL family protein